MPNKVKIFAWLYFGDRLSTKQNLFHKQVLDYSTRDRSKNSTDDRRRVFFECELSKDLWSWVGMSSFGNTSDEDVWQPPATTSLDQATWPLVLLIILWRL